MEAARRLGWAALGGFIAIALGIGTTAAAFGSLNDSNPVFGARYGADQSRNWSGYAAASGNVTSVTGTWTVPSPSAVGRQSADATWVGIGGVTGNDLIQAGTENTVLRSGAVRSNAWIELLPHPSHAVPLAVNPGDSVTTSIAQQSGNQWSISLHNNTSNQTFQSTLTYASSLLSAEWVEEAPSIRRGLVPLDNFGTLQVSGASAVKNGQSLNIVQLGAGAITMIDRTGQAIAVPSALGADGASFSITRNAGASNAEPQPNPGVIRIIISPDGIVTIGPGIPFPDTPFPDTPVPYTPFRHRPFPRMPFDDGFPWTAVRSR